MDTKTKTRQIKGMTCQNCVRHVTESLSKLINVESVTVSLEKGEAEITHHSNNSLTIQLEEAVVAAGYEIGHEIPVLSELSVLPPSISNNPVTHDSSPTDNSSDKSKHILSPSVE
ncbi:MAG: hypothetical protein IEMM0008_1586 [bacterium]|nr:MAG: hypothetical protein IEMM0008_1586 [bacterium]